MGDRRWIKAYEAGAAATKRALRGDDKRLGAQHSRTGRAHVDVPHGKRTIRFYPLKDCTKWCGVTAQTLFNWNKHSVVVFQTFYGQAMLCKSEALELGRVHRVIDFSQKERPSWHEISCVLRPPLLAVRTALDLLRQGAQLSPSALLLLDPSLAENIPCLPSSLPPPSHQRNLY